MAVQGYKLYKGVKDKGLTEHDSVKRLIIVLNGVDITVEFRMTTDNDVINTILCGIFKYASNKDNKNNALLNGTYKAFSNLNPKQQQQQHRDTLELLRVGKLTDEVLKVLSNEICKNVTAYDESIVDSEDELVGGLPQTAKVLQGDGEQGPIGHSPEWFYVQLSNEEFLKYSSKKVKKRVSEKGKGFQHNKLF
jgi:hypothetical protein